jgi:dienelactone hydrolase
MAGVITTSPYDEYVMEQLPVTFNGYTYKSWIAYKRGAKPAPVILVFPNYAGLKQFDKDQAMFLAKLGYVGVAVDLYEETAEYMYKDRNPVVDFSGGMQTEGDYANMKDVDMGGAFVALGSGGKITKSQEQGLAHFKAAFAKYHGCLKAKGAWRDLMNLNLTKAKEHPAVHPKFAAAIGYCFGGQCVLDMVRMGSDLQGVVSFHGLLQSEPTNIFKDPDWDGTVDMTGVKNNYTTKCKVLIENAELDDHVTDDSIKAFQKEFNDAGVNWQINNHSQTHHGWALPPGVWATEYDEHSDRRSTNSMISFFAELFPDFAIQPVECNAAGTKLGQAINTTPDAATDVNTDGSSLRTLLAVAAIGFGFGAFVSGKFK